MLGPFTLVVAVRYAGYAPMNLLQIIDDATRRIPANMASNVESLQMPGNDRQLMQRMGSAR